MGQAEVCATNSYPNKINAWPHCMCNAFCFMGSLPLGFPQVVAAKPAAAKAVAKPKPAPKKVVAAAPKPAGNIKNLPKAL